MRKTHILGIISNAGWELVLILCNHWITNLAKLRLRRQAVGIIEQLFKSSGNIVKNFSEFLIEDYHPEIYELSPILIYSA
jgi:hypothetical protein